MSGEAVPYTVARVRQALATDPRTNELDVHVRIVGGDVYLTGTVASPSRRAAVVTVVREHLPAMRLHDDITVYPSTGSISEERLD